MGFRLGVLVLLGMAAPLARAEDTDARAMELYDNGVVLYDEGLYEDAIVAWESAYRLSERPALLYNVANAEERLGRYQEALDHLNRYRAYATADERVTLDRRITNLERRLEEQALRVNETPLPGPAPAFIPSTSQPSAGVTAPAPLPVAVRHRARTAPIVLYTLGGLGLATGATFGGLAFSARNQAGDLCVAGDRSTWCPAAARDEIERDRRMSTFADVGYGIALGGALGGTVALVAPRRDRIEVGFRVGPRSTTVRVAGVF